MYLWQEPLIEIFFGHSEADEENIDVMSPYKTEQELIKGHQTQTKIKSWMLVCVKSCRWKVGWIFIVNFWSFMGTGFKMYKNNWKNPPENCLIQSKSPKLIWKKTKHYFHPFF